MVGTIIVLISYLLEPVQNFLYRRKKITEYARLEWATTDSLQLQRAAYQGIGSGSWIGYLNAVPTTKSDELMGDLPHSYDTGSGSSCTGQEQLKVKQLNPASISPPSTSEGSEESHQSAAEDHGHCVGTAEPEPVPIMSFHATEQGTDPSRVEDSSKPTVAHMSPVTPTLPTTQRIVRTELREAHGDTYSGSELEPGRGTRG